MPIIQSAIKKLHQDHKRKKINAKTKSNFKRAILNFKRKPTAKGLASLYKAIDTAAKKNQIHKNKASRLKSRLSELVAKTGTKPQKSS